MKKNNKKDFILDIRINIIDIFDKKNLFITA